MLPQVISYKKQIYIVILFGLVLCFHRIRNFSSTRYDVRHSHTTAVLMKFVLLHGYVFAAVWLDYVQIR